LLWVATVAAIVVGAAAAGTNDVTDSDEATGDSAAAVAALDRSAFADEVPLELVLVEASEGASIDDASGVLHGLRDDLEALPQVARVRDPILSPDGTAALVQVELDSWGEDSAERDVAAAASAAVEEVVAGVQDAYPSVTIEHTGDVALDEAISQIYDDDLRRAELFSLPVTLVILVLAFGALVAASVPLLLALSAVAAAMGLSQLASHVVPMADEVSSVILLVGMAVGVDYSLFYIRREREERLKGRDTYDAVAVAAATSGRAVVVSGVTVIIAMAGMFLSGDGTFASLAVGTIAVVAVAVVGSVTVLPALLAIVGRWIDRPRVPLVWRLQSRDGNPRFWRAVLRPVLARPAITFTVGAGVLVALAVPALTMKLGDPGVDDLPQGQPAIAAYSRLVELFPDEGASHDVVVWSEHGGPLDQAAVGAAVAELDTRLDSDARFAVEDSLRAEYALDGDVASIDVPIPDDYSSDAAVESLEVLRARVAGTLGAVAGTDAGVTGDTAWTADFRDQLNRRMPLVVAFVLGLTIIVLVMAFRSLTIALTSVVLNLLSVGAAYGLVTSVFQGTWAEDLLDFHSSGAILTWLPLFLFVILFGLSMDYHVFVVSRIREAREEGLETRAAVAQGITRSAGTVTSAAVVMVAVFSIFATLSALEFKQLGVGLAAAILIDATLVRAVLLPSAMVLLGERNWYLPQWMHRLPLLH
jgi:RND superfamily putative drug exporter